jgi:hypothetical protein
MFLPLEKVWSVDAWLGRRRGGSLPRRPWAPEVSVASGAILGQIALVYLFSAIFKSNANWLRGEAMAGALAHDFYASTIGTHLLEFPRLLTVLTWSTFVLEWLAPLLLFFPIGTVYLRMALVAALSALHIGIGVFMEVGLFPFVSLTALTLFLPAGFWNSRYLAGWVHAPECEREVGPPSSHMTREQKRFAPMVQAGCTLFLIYVIAVNVNGLASHPLASLAPENWKPLAMGCGLGQRWGMFESAPSNSGWYVAKAKLNDGEEVDLLQRGAPITWNRPEFPAGMYPNDRWRKLFREMAYYDEFGFQEFRVPVARYLCRAWNAVNAPERQVAEFEFTYCSESAREARTGPVPPALRQRLVHLDLKTM